MTSQFQEAERLMNAYTIHMYSMPKTVQLSEEAYASLAALKREGESFSDVVKRLVRSRKEPRALMALKGPREDFDLEALRRQSRERDLAKLARTRGG
jgi:predicted CopG family antitoxin